jgi:hypothetical protein
MAGHNARFWRSPKLRAAADTARATVRRTAWRRRYLSIAEWYRRARRRLDREHRQPAADVYARVNNVLVPRLQMTRPLTREEIVHLVDVHRPPHDPAPLQIGLRGFDVDHLSREYLEGFDLTFYKTHGWSGYVSRDQLNPSLRAIDARLGRRYPDDGVFFSACWRRRR